MDENTAQTMVHKVSNLLAAIYAFGEPALETGQGMAEALREILAVGVEVEQVLQQAKRELRRPEEQ